RHDLGSRHDLKTPDASRARGQDPDRFCVAADGRRDAEIVDAERACQLFRRDAIGHQGGDAAAGRAVDVEGAELDEAVEHSVAGAGGVYAVGDALSYRVPGVTAASAICACGDQPTVQAAGD